MFKSLFSRSPDPAELDLESFVKAVRGGEATVVDVREPHEFAVGHIPGAVNQPLSSFNPDELPNARAVVLICQAGGRSRRALDQAHAAGRNDVAHYPGGMSQWRSNGGEVSV
jgi:rhodanese-related sulfurtransferase